MECDDDFEDLFAEAELLQSSSQSRLTSSEANKVPKDCVASGEDLSKTVQWSQDGRIGSLDDSMSSQSGVAIPNDLAGAMPQSTLKSCPNSDVINKIESAFEDMTDALLNEKDEISITLRSRNSRSGSVAHSRTPDTIRQRRLCFPGKSAEEAWRFSMVLRILELVHEALRNDVVLSKRDIYYRDPALFVSQSQVDRYVDDIAFTFGVPRSSLNITAVAKGLLAGAVKLCRRCGTIVDAAEDKEGILIPSLKDILSVDLSQVRWILVIEKEATFRSIAASDLWDVIIDHGIIMTGKGYPDLSTRAMLHFLSIPSPHNGFASPMVYGIADFDPDGIAIMSTYKNGSKALAHESAGHCVPQLEWLGLRSEHLLLNDVDKHAEQGVLLLSSRDRAKATKMLENLAEDETEAGWRRELQLMLMLNTKAELQLLDAIPGGMANMLESELGRK